MCKLAILRINFILIHLVLTVSAQSISFLSICETNLAVKVQEGTTSSFCAMGSAKAGCGMASQVRTGITLKMKPKLFTKWETLRSIHLASCII